MTDRAAVDFSDCIAEDKQEDLIKAISTSNYFSLFTDGSTDSAVIKEEMIYLLFLNEGKPDIKFFSIKTTSHTTAEGLKEAISSEFKRTGMTEFHTKLAGFNVDGALVNTVIQKGLAQLLHESSPCLNVVIASIIALSWQSKTFRAAFFKDIDTLLNKIIFTEKALNVYENFVNLVRFMKNLYQN